MHAVRETNTPGENVAAVSADADTTIAPVSASESTSAMPINEDAATAIAGAANTLVGGETGELLCQETLQNNPATHKNKGMGPPPSSSNKVQDKAEANPPQINTPTPKSTELLASIANLDNVFLGPPLALWPEDELQNIEETEVMPIELEDDNWHVICPTCYDFLPKAHYLLHRHSQNCHPPSRPPEAVEKHGLEPHHKNARGKGRPIRSELIGEQKSGWPPADRPPAIRKAEQHEVQYWTTIREKMTAVYKKALRKPNVDGTYNVNGQITSLQELKRQIWNLPRCF